MHRPIRIFALFLAINIIHLNSSAYQISSSSSETNYSGKSKASKSTLSKPSSQNSAIYAIEMAERSDDPCYLKAKYKNVDTGVNSSLTYDECDGKEKSKKTITLPTGAYVSGVRVCLNSKDDKVKGIQLLGNYGFCLNGSTQTYPVEGDNCSPVNNYRGLDYRICNLDEPKTIIKSCSTEQKSYYERTNCVGSNKGPDSDWEKTVRCPKGKVATGLKLNIRDGGKKRKMYNGIALVCNSIK